MKTHTECLLMWGFFVMVFNRQCTANPCEPDPCLNGGSCTGSGETASCTCDTGFGGDKCELEPQCTDNSECLNDGTCNTGSGQYVCDCTAGYGGDTCQLAPKCTDAIPCENGGTCKANTTGQHVCFCAPDAPKCTDAILCLNGGTCKAETTGQDICFCATGFGGDLCADASGAATISGHFLLLTVVAVLAKLNLN